MSKPIICKDKIHCSGDCPNLVPDGGCCSIDATCKLTGNDLMWHDYWVAECDVAWDAAIVPLTTGHSANDTQLATKETGE